MSGANAPGAALSGPSPTTALAEFVYRTDFATLPHEVRTLLPSLLVDYFRVASVGRDAPWVGKVLAGLAASIGQPQASILMSDARADVVRAAGINGIIAGSLEWDDTHVGAMLHPGVVVWPAALAMAQHRGCTGPQIIAAVAAGYETMIRIGLSVQPAHFRRGFQSTATCGVFGAAAAAAKLAGLDTTGIRNALGIAASYAGGVTQFFLSGSEVKRIHAGKAAAAGVEAALFAASGLSGPKDILEGRQGFAQAQAGQFNPAAIVDGLGQDWQLRGLQLKPHAVSSRVLAAAEAAEILARRGVRVADVDDVVIGIPAVIEGRLTNNDPADLQQAQMSAPFATAMALSLTPAAGAPLILGFAEIETALQSPETRALSRKISCTVDDEVEALSTAQSVGARVTVRLRSGAHASELVRAPLGSPARELTASDIVSRFREVVRHRVDPAAVDAWLAVAADPRQPDWANRIMALRPRGEESRP